MVKVDDKKCIGCGLCVSLCPDVFEIDANGKAKAISQKNSSCAKEAVDSCPVEAISG